MLEVTTDEYGFMARIKDAKHAAEYACLLRSGYKNVQIIEHNLWAHARFATVTNDAHDFIAEFRFGHHADDFARSQQMGKVLVSHTTGAKIVFLDGTQILL